MRFRGEVMMTERTHYVCLNEDKRVSLIEAIHCLDKGHTLRVITTRVSEVKR